MEIKRDKTHILFRRLLNNQEDMILIERKVKKIKMTTIIQMAMMARNSNRIVRMMAKYNGAIWNIKE